tara:strand:- start:18793 stop:19725 length:933 start_codon:yes stop_codon:yes gene_type:complete
MFYFGMFYKEIKMTNVDLFGNEVVEKGSLKDSYIVPPFSILDTVQGDWFNRKRKWTTLGIQSELGRDAECVPSRFGNSDEEYFKKYGRKPMSGTSIFDPVLCEIMYSWFVKEGGSILDPFAGGSVRGIVANYLGYNYTGVELRQEQVDANMQQGIDILNLESPEWICGDSNQVLDKMDRQFDFVFSCPPYYDLEVYCDDPNDLSNMSYNEFNEVYESIIYKSCKLLRNNSFACFVVGNCRDKNGYLMDLVGNTIRAFEKSGLRFYNDIVLKNAYGTAMLRASNTMTYKKVVKVHQNVLVFCKGNPKSFIG